jgi:hypothetical protein
MKEIIINNDILAINQIVEETNRLLGQLSGFITNFNNILINAGVNTCSTPGGDFYIDAPGHIPESELTNVTKKLGIVDRLIHDHHQSISDLFKKGAGLESSIKKVDPSYTSPLGDQMARFKSISSSYKHLMVD